LRSSYLAEAGTTPGLMDVMGFTGGTRL